MIVGARRAGLSISDTDLLGFSWTTLSRVFSEWCEKRKTCSEQRSYRQRCLVDERGQRRKARLIWADTMATITQITTFNYRVEEKSISECTTWRNIWQTGYNRRTPNGKECSVVVLLFLWFQRRGSEPLQQHWKILRDSKRYWNTLWIMSLDQNIFENECNFTDYHSRTGVTGGRPPISD